MISLANSILKTIQNFILNRNNNFKCNENSLNWQTIIVQYEFKLNYDSIDRTNYVSRTEIYLKKLNTSQKEINERYQSSNKKVNGRFWAQIGKVEQKQIIDKIRKKAIKLHKDSSTLLCVFYGEKAIKTRTIFLHNESCSRISLV